MFFTTPITGISLPSKTLCLTYDDGPGPSTLRIARFLAEHEVAATFFVCGKHADQLPQVLPEIQELGHLLGNHTYDHPNLVERLAAGEDIVKQVVRTRKLIGRSSRGITTYFRAPYLQWSAAVADALNGNMNCALAHVGPIGADYRSRDWAYWANERSPEECADALIRNIGARGRGIVLMHDSTVDQEASRQRWMTHRLTEIVVPSLLAMGYSFVRLDEVPGVVAVTQVSRVCGLPAIRRKHASLAGTGNLRA